MPLTALLVLALLPKTPQGGPLRFVVRTAVVAPFEGRAVVYLSKKGGEPRFGPDWFDPQPCYSAPVTRRDGAVAIVDDGDSIGFPGRLSALKPGEYTVQAVIDRNLGGRAIGESPGNCYSKPVKLSLDPQATGDVVLDCDQIVPERRMRETDRIKEFRFQSNLLSRWYHRPTFLTGAVLLPTEYASDPARRFPIVYEVPGFGGSATDAGNGSLGMTMKDGESFIAVILDPNCPTGHCVFADSANNGPWGKALTTEFIPALEKKYRTYGETETRLVTGHSSGGWSSLWLQVAYPGVFGGVWSTSPDPVDFHDFQGIDLYKPGVNMFRDEQGRPRPIARMGETPMLFYKPFSDMERPIRGEQLGSFEAVFSPKGPDGQPEKLWDRDTGAVDHAVAMSWQRNDIAWKLREEWPRIGLRLKGKLHVFTGATDTFYLEGAVKRLKPELQALGSDAEVEIVPGDHFTMMSAALRAKIDHEMAESVRRWKANHRSTRSRSVKSPSAVR